MITTTVTETRTVNPTRPVEAALRRLEDHGFDVVVRETYRGAVEISFDNRVVFGAVRVGVRTGRFVGGNASTRSREWSLDGLADVRALAEWGRP